MKVKLAIEKSITEEKYWVVINNVIYIQVTKETAYEIAKALKMKKFLKELQNER